MKRRASTTNRGFARSSPSTRTIANQAQRQPDLPDKKQPTSFTSLSKVPATASLQTRLHVDSSHDRYEREANQIADRMLRGPAAISPSPPSITPLGQHQTGNQHEGEWLSRSSAGGPSSQSASASPGKVAQAGGAVATGGRVLSPFERGFFEPRFGRNLGGIRVHEGPRAAQAAHDIQAKAFTLGHHIGFASGQYSPGTSHGLWLMAHELTHVIQQERHDGNAPYGDLGPGPGAQLMRSEREVSPSIKAGESWFFADDPIGHIASIYFETGSSEIQENAAETLILVKEEIENRNSSKSLISEGYTDRAGDPSANQLLSLERARNVGLWLRQNLQSTFVNQISFKTSGLGEQGPEPTLTNSATLSRFRRVDIIIAPPKATTFRQPVEGSPLKHGSPTLKLELQRSMQALDNTLHQLTHHWLHLSGGGEGNFETQQALERHFPHDRYRSLEFLSTLIQEIGQVRDRIESVRFLEIPIGSAPSNLNDCFHWKDPVNGSWDIKLCKVILKTINPSSPSVDEVPAFTWPRDNPSRIYLTPAWYGHPHQASVLVHEAVHLLLGLIEHPREVPHRNPYAFSRLVTDLGSLP